MGPQEVDGESWLLMSWYIFVLLMLAALGHSLWNAISRGISERDAFFTLILVVAVILYAPVAAYLSWTHPVPRSAWPWIATSMSFEILYFISLAKAYREGSFLTVYPVARGSAPILVTIFSFLMTHRFVGIIGLSGIIFVVIGILLINQTKVSLEEAKLSLADQGIKWALLTGICTASYSVADSMGVAIMNAVLFKYIVFIGMVLGKLAYDLSRRNRVSYVSLLRRYPSKTLIAGFLVFGVIAIVVYAMQSTPVAFVSATRETSIVFATVIGIIWLKERIGTIKAVSLFLILSGAILIKLG